MNIYYKIISLSLLLLFLTLKGYSQAPLVKFGVKTGFNFSDLAGDYERINTRLGYIFGAVVDVEFKQGIVLTTGLELTKKGANLDEFDHKGYIDAVYGQIPLQVGYRLRFNDDWGLRPHAGVYYAYGLFGDSRTDMDGFQTFNHKFKHSDYGFGLGGGIEYKSFCFDFNYNRGLTSINISHIEGKEIPTKNISYEFTVTHRFSLFH